MQYKYVKIILGDEFKFNTIHKKERQINIRNSCCFFFLMRMVNLCSASNLEPWFGNHGSQILGERHVRGTKSPRKFLNRISDQRVGLFYLRLALFLMLNWLGLFYLWLKLGLGCVLLTCGWKSVWSFLLTVPPVGKFGLVFFAYGFPTVSKKDKLQAKWPQL